jgi:uncharacterized membrane protein YfhO
VKDEEALRLLADEAFDPLQEAVLAGPVPVSLAGNGEGGSSATVVLRTPQRLVVDVEAKAAGLLMLSEVYYPGWEAWVDGEKATVLRAQHTLRAVQVAPGAHRVEMTFQPVSVRVGMAISALTLVLSLAFLAWDWRRPVDA